MSLRDEPRRTVTSSSGRAANGRSSIYRDANGTWHGRVSMGVRADGRPDRRHVRGRTEKEVAAKVRRLEQGRDRGEHVRIGAAPTVKVWLEHWLEHIARPSIRPKSYAAYATAVNKHLIPALGEHRLDTLKPQHIEALYTAMRSAGARAATVHQVHRTLRTALEVALRRGELTANPSRLARAPRVEQEEIEPLSVAEARRILQAARGIDDGVRYTLALALGMRQGEVLGLKWSDLNLDAGVSSATLTISRALQRHTWRHGCSPDTPCGGPAARCPARHSGGLVLTPPKSASSRRSLVVPEPLVEELRHHREIQRSRAARAGELWAEQGLVFTNARGGPVDPRQDLERWKQLLKAAQVRDARLHDARHTAATLLLIQGVDSRTVMDLMGWSQVSMTKRYQHVVAELRDQAAGRVAELLWGKDHP